MARIRRRNRKNIQHIFEEKTGTVFSESSLKAGGYRTRGLAIAAAMLCLVSAMAFSYSRFSGLNGDELIFDTYYKGDGIFEIKITNLSDKELELQDMGKLMQWSSSREVEGASEKIKMENTRIEAHSEETMLVDLSQAYDIALLEKDLPGNDWYYLVLTNNHFAFGQDWMCTLDFDREKQADAEERHTLQADLRIEEIAEVVDKVGFFASEGWVWPTESRRVSTFYGEQPNGNMSDHVNIVGNKGDEVYALAEAKVLETGFERESGNYVILGLENDIVVRYGHLQEYNVEAGDTVTQGQVIGKLGQSGIATGPNLLLRVEINGESVDPFAE